MKRPLLLVLTLMLAVVVVGCNSSKRKSGDNVVAKVEQFRKANGRLPNALPDIGPRKMKVALATARRATTATSSGTGPL